MKIAQLCAARDATRPLSHEHEQATLAIVDHVKDLLATVGWSCWPTERSEYDDAMTELMYLETWAMLKKAWR